jgi:hypothetical protein
MTKRLDYNEIAPNGAKALGGVYGYVVQSGLPGELVELVHLRVSQINNCAYCLDMQLEVEIMGIFWVWVWGFSAQIMSRCDWTATTFASSLARSEAGT